MADKRIHELVETSDKSGKYIAVDEAGLSEALKYDTDNLLDKAQTDLFYVKLTGNESVDGIKTWNNNGVFDAGITVTAGGIAVTGNSSILGTLGIGTVTPVGLLHIHQSDRPYLKWSSDTTGQASGDGTVLGFATAAGEFQIRNKEAQAIALMTSDSTRMWIAADGKVGINTTGPTDKLSILLGANTNRQIDFHLYTGDVGKNGPVIGVGDGTGGYPHSGAGNLIMQPRTVGAVAGTGDFVIMTGSTPAVRFVVDEDGNVGINTTAPGEKLQVDGDIYQFGGTYGIKLRGNSIQFDRAGSNYIMATASAGDLIFITDARSASKANANLVLETTVKRSWFGDNLGIATGASPTERLQINAPGEVKILMRDTSGDDDDGAGRVVFESDIAGRSSYVQGYRGATSNQMELRFYVYNSGSNLGMKIDYLGNTSMYGHVGINQEASSGTQILTIENNNAYAQWTDYPTSLPVNRGIYIDRPTDKYGDQDYSAIVLVARGGASVSSIGLIAVGPSGTGYHTKMNFMLRGSSTTDYRTVMTLLSDQVQFKAESISSDLIIKLIQAGSTKIVMGFDDSADDFIIHYGTAFTTTSVGFSLNNVNHVGFGTSAGTEQMNVYDVTTGLLLLADFHMDGNSVNAVGPKFSAGQDTPSASDSIVMQFGDGNKTPVGSILFDTTSCRLVSSISSKKYKKDIADLDINATEKLKAVKPRKYKFKGRTEAEQAKVAAGNKWDKELTGYVAEELELVIPEAVTDLVDGQTGEIYKAYSDTTLIKYLHKAILELEARLATLETP